MLISAFCDKTATILPFLRETMDGEVYDAPQVRRCRLEPAPQIQSFYHGFSGEVEEENAKAIMYTEGEPIPVRSSVQVDNQKYIALRCAVYHGFPGSYLEVTLA